MGDKPHGSTAPGPTKQTQDRRITDLILEAMTAAPAGRPGRNAADPFRVANATTQSLDRVVPLIFGVVVHAVPYLNWYKVQTFEEGFIGCCSSQHTATTPMGVHQGSVIPPNTVVLVYKPPHLTYGIIVCALPPLAYSNAFSRPDYLVQGGRSGIRVEPAHQQPLRAGVRSGGVMDFSCGSPIDATSMEWSLITETGLAFLLDPFQAYLRVNEHCGIFLNLFDSYARLIGVNLDIFSAVHEETYKNDEGENTRFFGVSVYPWEAFGNFTPGGGCPHTAFDAKKIQSGLPVAPQDFNDAQIGIRPFKRYQEYHGYLGQGGIRQLCAPPGLEGLNTTSDATGRKAASGLFSESIGLDGSYTVRTAKSILLVKRCNIPIAQPTNEAESAGGDSAENGYRASGYFGSGSDHKVGDLVGLDSAAKHVDAIHEFIAYACNWKNLHPFHYHSNDFGLPEEAAATNLVSVAVAGDPNEFKDLEQASSLDHPTAYKLNIDHRYGNTNYYARQSFFAMPDDGSIVLGCGYGSRLAMVGGKLRLDSASDIEIVSGGNIVLMGRNVITNAAKSVDVTATSGDVRLAAKNNMQMTANGILLDAKSEERDYVYSSRVGEQVVSHGVVVRSAGDMSFLSDNMYLRSGITNSTGSITLDAATRGGAVRIEAELIAAATVNGLSVAIGPAEQPLTKVYQFGQDAVILPSSVYITGSLDVTDGNVFFGETLSVGGDVISGRRVADSTGGMIGQVPDNYRQRLRERAAADRKLTAAALTAISVDLKQIELLWRGNALPGNATMLQDMTFSYRDDQGNLQYKTADLEFLEPRWLQTTRLANVNVGETWSDPGILYQGEKLYPWPGKQHWTGDGPMLRAKKAVLYDPQNGVAVSRSQEVYQNPDLSSNAEKVNLLSGLRITDN